MPSNGRGQIMRYELTDYEWFAIKPMSRERKPFVRPLPSRQLTDAWYRPSPISDVLRTRLTRRRAYAKSTQISQFLRGSHGEDNLKRRC